MRIFLPKIFYLSTSNMVRILLGLVQGEELNL